MTNTFKIGDRVRGPFTGHEITGVIRNLGVDNTRGGLTCANIDVDTPEVGEPFFTRDGQMIAPGRVYNAVHVDDMSDFTLIGFDTPRGSAFFPEGEEDRVEAEWVEREKYL